MFSAIRNNIGYQNVASLMRATARNTTVASLGHGWVTPGAATEGVTPLFFPEKPVDLFLLIAVTITIAFLLLSLECHPLFFTCPTSFLHYSLQICPQFFSFGCHPPGGCHPGRSPSPPALGTPLRLSSS